MSESAKYTCKKCGVKFRPDRWPECSNCQTPVPAEIREQFVTSETADVATWQTIFNISKPQQSTPARDDRSRGKKLTGDNSDSLSSFDPAIQISADAKAIIASQNRTTHAVKAVVEFLISFFGLSAVGTSLIVMNLPVQKVCDRYGSCETPSISFFYIFGILLVLLSPGLASYLARRELRKA